MNLRGQHSISITHAAHRRPSNQRCSCYGVKTGKNKGTSYVIYGYFFAREVSPGEYQGGYGILEGLLEVIARAQLGIHDKQAEVIKSTAENGFVETGSLVEKKFEDETNSGNPKHHLPLLQLIAAQAGCEPDNICDFEFQACDTQHSTSQGIYFLRKA